MKKGNMKKMMAILLSLTMAAGILTACGGAANDAAETPAEQPAEAGDAAQGGQATELETTGDVTGKTDAVINVGYGTEISTLTPFRPNTGQDAPYMTLLYESLVVLNENGEYEKWCAKDYSTNDNGFTYDVEIYDNIVDAAGNHITADDIVWEIQETINVALKPDFAKIESVEKTGDYTFQVKLKDNMVGLFESLMKHTFVVSQKAYEESADSFATDCVTTSAYKVVNYVAPGTLDFERRDDYWQTDESLIPACVVANTKGVNFIINTEASQLGIALETGTVDVVIDLAAATAVNYVDNDSLLLELTDNMQGWELFFSGADSRPVGNDLALRQAICYALDAQTFIDGVCFGYGSPMYDVCPPTSIGYLDKWESEDYYPCDLEKAAELVKQSDYAGQELVILCSQGIQRTAEIIQASLAQIGVNVKLDVADMGRISAIRLDGREYDMFINTIGATTLANHWSIRYDPNAYEIDGRKGDGTSRHDEKLGELLYKTWTVDGYTEENIDEVHAYIKDQAIAYGLYNPKRFTYVRKDAGLSNEVKEYAGYLSVAASTFTKGQ